MPAAFTTWTALLDQLKEDLATGNFRRVASYSIANRTTTYRTVDEFWALYREVEARAAEEEGLAYAQVCTVPAGVL